MSISKKQKQTSEEIKGYKILMPSELILEKILAINPPAFVYNLDFFKYLIHLTIDLPARNKNLIDHNGYVPFKAEILQKKRRNYRDHLDYLVANKVLDELPFYEVDRKCKRFRIAEKFLSDKLTEINLTDSILIKHLTRENGIDFATTIEYKNLYKWFNDRLKIDADAAIKYCYAQLQKEKHENYYQAYCSAYRKILKIKMIENRNFWFNQDGFGNRLHTNMTNLDKDLKQFITYNGESLVSIDIKNSQPYMSLKILIDEFPELKHTNLHLTPPTYQQTTPPISIMLVNRSQNIDLQDVIRYGTLVVNGTLYEYMEAKIREAFGDVYFTKAYIFDMDKLEPVKNDLTPRDRVKKVMFQVFFSANETTTKEKELFRQLFPTVTRVFEKRKDNKHVIFADRYKRLAKELQKIESSAMLDKIVWELSTERPQIPLYTIHDSIVTTIGNEDFVRDIMQKLLNGEIGFEPTLSIEYWCKDCAGFKQAA